MRSNYLPSLLQAAGNSIAEKNGFSSPLQALKKMYGEVRAHDVLLQCMYMVRIEDIFNIGSAIPWFKDESLCFLITESDLSFGGSEGETFNAGALPASYLTMKTGDEMNMTFIETINGDIFKSYKACQDLAFNDDGTVNEPRKYTFKITVALIDHKHPNKPPPISKSWLVAVKSGSADVSSAGRSEIIKEPITFQKIRPLLFAK